jgi:hypothetical protein
MMETLSLQAILSWTYYNNLASCVAKRSGTVISFYLMCALLEALQIVQEQEAFK